MARYIVERPEKRFDGSYTFDDVGADEVVFEGDTVAFYSVDSNGGFPNFPIRKFEVAYATGQWVTVCDAGYE